QRLVAPGAELRAEDRGVGEGVAVDRAGRDGRQPAGRRLGVGPLELAVVLGDVEGARERLPRVDPGPEAGESGQQEVDLQLRTLGLLALRSPEQDVEHRGGDVGEHVAPGGAVVAHAVVPGDLGTLRTGADRADTGAGTDLDARGDRG